MVINVLDHVPHCHTWSDGDVIGNLLRRALRRGERAVVSFHGVADVPSSFVNAAFISLLDSFDQDFIKAHLSVVDSTRQINSMIRQRFQSEATRAECVAA